MVGVGGITGDDNWDVGDGIGGDDDIVDGVGGGDYDGCHIWWWWW